MHITHHGSRHLGILSLLSLVACNDAQLKTLGDIETQSGGGSAGAASSQGQSDGGASGGSATESTAGAEAGAEPSSAAGSGDSLPNGAGGSLPNAGGGGGDTTPNAGSAGASIDDGIDACSNKTWTATATVVCTGFNGSCNSPGNVGPETPAQAIDGDPKTRYTTGQAQDGTEEFVVAFASSVTISGITVDTSIWYALVGGQGVLAFDFAIAYALEFSTDGLTFVPFSPPITGPGRPDPLPMACGLGGSCTMAIPFPPTAMKALKFRQIGSDVDRSDVDSWWSIVELNVIACKEN